MVVRQIRSGLHVKQEVNGPITESVIGPMTWPSAARLMMAESYAP